jgi:hypothetical protein
MNLSRRPALKLEEPLQDDRVASGPVRLWGLWDRGPVHGRGLSGPQGLSCRSILMVDRSFLRALGSPGWGLARWGVGRVPARAFVVQEDLERRQDDVRPTGALDQRLLPGSAGQPVRRCPASRSSWAASSGVRSSSRMRRPPASWVRTRRWPFLGVCASSVMRFRTPTRLHPGSGMTHA